MKRLVLLLVALLALFLFGCGSDAESKETQASEPEPTVVTEDQKSAFTAFETEINDLSARQAELFGLVAEAEGKMTAGEFTALDMYELADIAEESANNIWTAYGDVEITDVYSKAHKEVLKKVVDDLEMSAFLHKEAYGAYKKYLDTGSLEEANQFNDDIESSQQYTMAAAVGITQVKMDLGIE